MQEWRSPSKLSLDQAQLAQSRGWSWADKAPAKHPWTVEHRDPTAAALIHHLPPPSPVPEPQLEGGHVARGNHCLLLLCGPSVQPTSHKFFSKAPSRCPLHPCRYIQLCYHYYTVINSKHVSVENANKNIVVPYYACVIHDADTCPCFVWAMAGALCLTHNHAPNSPDTACVIRS